MQTLLRNLMMRFIRLKYLTEDSTALRLCTVQVNNEKKHKVLNKIDVGTKVRYLFPEPDLLPSEKQKKVQKM